MDPNATLIEIRNLLKEFNGYSTPWGPRPTDEITEELACTVDDLVEWLDVGGFLPSDWQRQHHGGPQS